MKDELFAMTFRGFCKEHGIRLLSMKLGRFSGMTISCRFDDMRNSEFRIRARMSGLPDGLVKLTIRLRKFDFGDHYTVCLAKGMALDYTDKDSLGILYDFMRKYGHDYSPLF